MAELVPNEITAQVTQAVAVLKRHLQTLCAIHLFGSAVDGGLKPNSDIDLLVTVTDAIDEATRQALLLDLLTASAPVSNTEGKRPLEVTVVKYAEIIPWHYPTKRELQFGEWLRADILAGIYEPALIDHDLAILLTKVRQHSIPIIGPIARKFFQPVASADFLQALMDTLKQWNIKEDWQGDERNIVLALARIWYSVATGKIAPKDIAASWLLERLPAAHKPLVSEAKQAYLANTTEYLLKNTDAMAAFVSYAKSSIEALLNHKN